MLTPLLLLTMSVVPTKAVVVTGQSLALGYGTGSALTTTQTGNNQMSGAQSFDGTTLSVPMSDWPFTALLETGYALEHPRNGLADYYRTATGIDMFIVSAGRSASTYAQFLASPSALFQAATIESYGARVDAGSIVAAYLFHGESDQNAGTSRAAYQTVLAQWQSDIQAKVRASTRTGA